MNRRMRPTAASSRNCRTAGVSARCGYRPTNNGVHRRHPTYNGTNGTPRRSTEPKHIGYGSIHRANRTKSGRPAPYRIPEHRADKDSIPLKIQATVSSLSEFADFRRLFHGRLRIENPSTETDLTPLDHAGSFGFPGNRHLVRRKMRNGTNQNFPYLTSRKIGILRKTAATPETIGAAILVPCAVSYPPSGAVDRTFSPGASRSTFSAP